MLSNGQKTKLRTLRAAMDGGVALAAAQGAAKKRRHSVRGSWTE